MEQKIKIIKLIKESKNNKKKKLYTDILNSSKKVQDIIKKTKINKNKFYSIQNKNTKINSEKDQMKSFKYEFNNLDDNKNKTPQLFIPKKTKCNKQTFITFNKIYKKTLKNKSISKYNSKKINNNCSSSIKYINNDKKKNIRLFTNYEIDKFINVLTYYGEYELFKNIHKYIKKLNKYQTNQILKKLLLVNKKSNAPIKILKNILYNYFCCNLIISR